MGVKERTVELIKAKNKTIKQFEEECQLSNGYVSSMRKGFGTLKLNNVLSAFPDVNREWLLYGEGEMLKQQSPTAVVNYECRGVPYYNVDFVCGFNLIENDQTINPEYYIDFKQYNNATFWVNASGDSMRPVINSGDMLAIRPLPDDWQNHILYGETYALVLAEGRTIKKIRKSKLGDQYLRLIPENTEDFDEQDILRKNIVNVFQVLGCMKKLL